MLKNKLPRVDRSQPFNLHLELDPDDYGHNYEYDDLTISRKSQVMNQYIATGAEQESDAEFCHKIKNAFQVHPKFRH
jgi:hypothetical protein